jgi:phosphoribosylanthranilate isomerase
VPLKVKICGVRRPEDARAAVLAGADFLGLNFDPASPRSVSLEEARAVAAAVPGTPLVGVFVDARRADVVAAAHEVGLALLQFHGDEDPTYCEGWTLPVIKALRVRPGATAGPLAARYATAYLLVDRFVEGLAGGTGVPLDPGAAQGVDPARLFFAGGLRPDTVAAVVRVVRPFAVDVASGVEESPGRKDHAKVEEFIRRAKAA